MKRNLKILGVLAGMAAASMCFAACSLIGEGGEKGGDGSDNTPSGSVQVTFSAGDGAFADNEKSIVLKPDGNGKVGIEKMPVYDGHAFVGWFDGNKEYDPKATYSSNCTFTAKYVSGDTDKVYSALFDENSTVSIEMNMSDAEWKKLDNDYTVFNAKNSKSPIYRMADSVTIGIDDGKGMLYYYYEEVGVRMKGNTSRHRFYGEDGFYNNIHMKLSFKQTFDDVDDGYKTSELKVWEDANARAARKNRKLGGMEKIDIKYNSTGDETYARELYAMKLFRENGVVAPNVTLCSVTALEKDTHKKNLGIYRIHECIDETFITRNFGESENGDLWKCTYTKTGPADLTNFDLDKRIGVEDEMKGKFYSYDKKTNKKKDKVTGLRDFSSMTNFIRAINSNGADLSQYLDVDNFAKFEAVNYILGNPDCIRNNYNNYYLYFRKSDGKAVIIPYDYDRCLGLTHDYNPTGSASMYLEPYTRRIAATGDSQINPIYKGLICKGAPTGSGSALMKYRSNLQSLSKSTQLSAETFNAYKNNYKSKYGRYATDALKTNAQIFDDNKYGNVSYATYIQTKIGTLNSNIDNYRYS